MQEAILPENETERLADVLSLSLSSADKKEQFDGVIMILSRCLKMPIAYISSIESIEQKIHASCGLSFDSSDRKTSFCGHTILQDEVLLVEDTTKDARFFDNPMVINKPKIRFYGGFPLVSLLGNKVGALCVADTVPRKLNETDIRIFKMIGKLLNERIRMFKLGDIQDQIKESQRELEVLNQDLQRSNQFYHQLFGQYMSEALLERVISENIPPKLGGEDKFATVLMSDLRGFTQLSEKYEAKIIVEILNIYFTEMISIIHENEGYINEILGDGILVVFGAPKHVGNCAAKAVKCAREMQGALVKVNKQLRQKDFPGLEMGIGINSGNLIVGNIGSKERMKYGVIGETVNLAARLESLTFPSQILITEKTFSSVEGFVDPVGKIRVKIKGFTKPITIYDVSDASSGKI